MSMTSSTLRNPVLSQSQWAGTQYTTVLTSEKRQYAWKLHLSIVS